MANFYPYFDNGSWEGYLSGIEYNQIFRPGLGYQNFTSLQKSNEQAFAGAYAGKIILVEDFQPSTGIAYLLTALKTISTGIRPISMVIGSTYTIKCRVFTPSSAPIGSDDMPIGILPGQNRTLQSGDANIYTTVGACKDQWVEISYTFLSVYPDGPTGVNSPLYIACSPSYNAVNYSNIGVPRSGNVNQGGVLFIDNVSLDVALPPCDLQFQTPAYSKTDETVLDENDGTITIFAEHSNPANDVYTRSYSINGVDWTLSNTFTGLAPGVYSIYARDNRGSGDCIIQAINAVTIIGIEEEPPPLPEPPESGELLINLQPLNQGNFIQWFLTSGNINFSGHAFQNCCWDLPRPYRYGRQKYIHAPIVVANEVFTFYWNCDEALTYPEFSSLKLGLINKGGLVVEEIGTLTKDTFTDGVSYNIYSEEVIVPSGTAVGKYRMAIYHSVSGDILFTSNIIEVLTVTDAECWSVKLWYRSTINLYKFYYERVTTYLNKIRLRLYLLDDPVEGEFIQYRGASTGRLRNVAVELDRYIVLEAHYFDDAAHRAMEIFQAHDIILVNEKPYLVKSPYKKEPNLRLNVYKGRIELYEQDFSTANRFGQGDITVVGSEDPLLLGDVGRIRL